MISIVYALFVAGNCHFTAYGKIYLVTYKRALRLVVIDAHRQASDKKLLQSNKQLAVERNSDTSGGNLLRHFSA